MEKNPHNKNLLVELFVEELPPKALNKLGESFANSLFESLKAQGLTLDNAVVTAFATPRRLAAILLQIILLIDFCYVSFFPCLSCRFLA